MEGKAFFTKTLLWGGIALLWDGAMSVYDVCHTLHDVVAINGSDCRLELSEWKDGMTVWA